MQFMLPIISGGNICYQPTFRGSNVHMQSVLLLLFSKLFSLSMGLRDYRKSSRIVVRR